MKIWILMLSGILWYTTVLGQNVGSVQDQLIREVAIQFNDEDYESVLLTLSKLENQERKGINNERYFYFSIRSRYNLLKEGQDITFENISKIRVLTQSYLSQFKNSKTSKVSEISDIHQDVNYNYPSTLEAYKHWQLEQERLVFERKQKEALHKVEAAFNIGQYLATLKQIEDARKNNFPSPKFDYYEILAKNELYKESNPKSYQSIQELVKISEIYLKQSDLNQIDRDVIEQLVQKFPKTLEEYNEWIELERLAAIEKDRGDKLSEVQTNYNRGSYHSVLQANDIYEAGSEKAASFNYFKAMASYKILLSKVDTYFSLISASDVSQVRYALVSYKNNYKNLQPGNKSEIDAALLHLDSKFGKDDLAFNKLKKEVIAEREKAIKRSQRSMFVSFGYEYGEIAPYGLRFEVGGRAVGFFTTIRSSMIKEEEIRNSYYGIANKNEIVIGPNIKIAKWLYFNAGAGYGYFSHAYRDDYKGEQGIKKSDYFAGYTGVSVRTGSVINLIGGASFMDITKKYTENLTAPEYTIGITFNFK